MKTTNSSEWTTPVGDNWDVAGYRYSLWTQPLECFGAKRAYYLCGVEISSGLRRVEVTMDLNFSRDQRICDKNFSDVIAAAPTNLRKILKRLSR
jgi:hypothetical protein